MNPGQLKIRTSSNINLLALYYTSKEVIYIEPRYLKRWGWFQSTPTLAFLSYNPLHIINEQNNKHKNTSILHYYNLITLFLSLRFLLYKFTKSFSLSHTQCHPLLEIEHLRCRHQFDPTIETRFPCFRHRKIYAWCSLATKYLERTSGPRPNKGGGGGISCIPFLSIDRRLQKLICVMECLKQPFLQCPVPWVVGGTNFDEGHQPLRLWSKLARDFL